MKHTATAVLALSWFIKCRMVCPKRTTLLLLLAASAVFAADDAYRAQIEKDRQDTDEFLRSPRSPLLLVGRFSVNEGASTLGSDPASTIILPANAPSMSARSSVAATSSRFQLLTALPFLSMTNQYLDPSFCR
jgi:hypothetical protein